MTAPDPDFPDRPDHPDFWLLARAVQDLDAQPGAGQPTLDIVARYVNPESAVYMAMQRALRALALPGAPGRERTAAVWLDGLLTGMIVQHLMTGAAAETEDGP
jgi:hypothetical protein